jgi:serine/threonine protein phosphatase PrpC
MSRAGQVAEVGVTSDTGRLRDHNEDSYLVSPPVYAVADGMGGHAAGEVASRLALESLESAGLRGESGLKHIRQALSEANRVVYQQASEEGPSRGMGTTCAVLIVADGVAHLGHVGDSRIYLLRGDSLTRLTRDHTVVADMVEEGLLTDEQAQTDSGRSYLTRALGGAPAVEADARTVETDAGDRLLLCSDGLTTMLNDGQIQAILAAEADPQVAADRLVSAANAAGGEDNITAIVVDPAPSVVPAVARPKRATSWIQAAIVVLALTAGILALLFFNGPLAPPPAASTPPAVQQPATPSPELPTGTPAPQSPTAPASPRATSTP